MSSDASPDDATSGSSETGFFQVVRDGAHPFGLTNGAVLSGEVQFPIEFALDATDEIVGVSFYYENSSPIIGALGLGTNNQWTLDWSTPMAFNGTYTIYAEVDFATNDPIVGFPVTVTVSNIISFPNYLSRVFGNQMWIYAQTITNAPYKIDMYDDNMNPLGSFLGNADGNGVISFLWDLTDSSGNTSSSTNFTGMFTVNASSFAPQTSKIGSSSLPRKILGVRPNGGSPSGSSAKQFWVKETQWRAKNTWVVAYGEFNDSAAQHNADTFMIAGGAYQDTPYGGVLGTLDEYGLKGNLSPGNIPQAGTVFTVNDAISQGNFLSYLASTEYDNFYFFGHGNASAIGSYNGFALTQGQIASALLNVPLSSLILHAALTPYRFVFIDGCNAGSANFCEAFAIPAQTIGTNFYAAAGLESRAFVGFKSWKLNFDIWSWQGYSLMTGGFLGDWQSGQVNVQTCVNNAVSDVHQTGASMNSSAVVYGAADLQHGTHTGQ
jgi:hypothetical protein